jgi:hypothetical protein
MKQEKSEEIKRELFTKSEVISQFQTHLFGQRAKTTCSSAICAQNLSWPLLNMGK